MNFWIQASNPRSLRSVDEEDQCISDAMQSIFPHMTEDAIMTWASVRIPLNYKYILSFLLYDVVVMLEQLMGQDRGTTTIHWPSDEFAATWRMQWDDNRLEIHAEWRSVSGHVEALLAARSPLVTDKRSFISEWKQVLGVALKALTEAGYRDTQLRDLAKLRSVHDAINEPGVLYREADECTNAA